MPVCGLADPAALPKLKETPVWCFHGETDEITPASTTRRTIEELRRLGGRPLCTEYRGIGHDVFMWAYTEPALVEWLFAQRRRGPQAPIPEERGGTTESARRVSPPPVQGGGAGRHLHKRHLPEYNRGMSSRPRVQAHDWKHTPIPRKHRVVSWDRPFTEEEMDAIRLGFLPRQMEDRWFLWFRGNNLHCHRSWTGFCIYEVRFLKAAQGYRAARFKVNEDPEQHQHGDDAHEISVLSALIDTHLLRLDGVRSRY